MPVAEPVSPPAAPSSTAVVALGGNALLRRGVPLEGANLAQAATLVLAQLVGCRNSRSERRSAFAALFSNGWLWAAIALSFALQLLVVHAPILNDAFDTAPLSVGGWLACTAIASVVLWADEAKKLLVRCTARRDPGASR